MLKGEEAYIMANINSGLAQNFEIPIQQFFEGLFLHNFYVLFLHKVKVISPAEKRTV